MGDVTGEYVEQIRSAFAFLQEEYRFAETKVRRDRPPREGCDIEYRSSQTIVGIVVDEWGTVWSPTIGRLADMGSFGSACIVSLDRIWEKERAHARDLSMLASHNPEDVREAWERVVVAGQLEMRRTMEATSPAPGEESTRRRLGAYAALLKQYSESFLSGDFSSWLDLQESNWHWLVAGEVVRDARGEKGHALRELEGRFSNVAEYLQALRRECGRD